MNMAEHSSLENSAPHGAPQTAANALWGACGAVSSDLFSSSAVAVWHRAAPAGPLEIPVWRRRASGRALLALAALGLFFETAPFAHSRPLDHSARSASHRLHRAARRHTARVRSDGAPHLTLARRVGSSRRAVATGVAATGDAVAPRRALMPRQIASPRLTSLPRAALLPRLAKATPLFPAQPSHWTLTNAKSAAPACPATPFAPAAAGAPTRARIVLTQSAAGQPGALPLVQPLASGARAALLPATPEPAATTMRSAPAASGSPDFGGMKKIINVPTLALPPLSQPLPVWMRNAAVKVDRLEKRARIAQNPLAPPVRNPGTPVTNSDRLPNQIEVAVSTFVVLLTTTDLQTVAVADPSVADVAVVNSRSVLLNGKTAGVTSLVIVDGQKIRQYTVRVTPAPGSRPNDVASSIGLPGVSVRQVREALVLEGEVASAEEARRATEIAGIYAPKVVNQLIVRGQVSGEAGMASQLRDLIALPNVNVRVMGDTAVLSGTVDTPQQIQDADLVARAVAKNVINQLRLPALTIDQVRQSLGAVDGLPLAATTAPGQLSTATPLSLREAGGQLILEGYVANQGEADLALSSANRTGMSIINRLQVRPAATSDQAFVSQVAAAIGRPGVIVRGTPKRLVLEGSVADTNEAVLVEQVARAFTTPGIGQVDNLLRTSAPVQCNIDVSIAELNSTDARQLGVQYGSVSLLSENTTGPTFDGTTGIQTSAGSVARSINPTFNQGVGTAGNGFIGTGGFSNIDPFRARINALLSNGKGRLLSNPTTTVLSGRTATFQVGGQVPVPSGSTTNASGTSTSITFKDYGILLDIVPNALPNGNVTLRIRSEVSQPDFSVGVTPPGGGSAIPGFSRRSTITEVTVPAGGTVALSGLITANDTRNETAVPILSRIPIIGSLFRSREFRQNKTELVFFVKPRVLPNPLGANSEAFAGVVAVGENSNRAAQMGNPGLNVFDGGTSIVSNVGVSQ